MSKTRRFISTDIPDCALVTVRGIPPDHYGSALWYQWEFFGDSGRVYVKVTNTWTRREFAQWLQHNVERPKWGDAWRGWDIGLQPGQVTWKELIEEDA